MDAGIAGEARPSRTCATGSPTRAPATSSGSRSRPAAGRDEQPVAATHRPGPHHLRPDAASSLPVPAAIPREGTPHVLHSLRRHHHRLRRGRRHAGPPAGALRQADPAARARRLRPAGARQLEHAGGQRRGQVPDHRSTGATRTGRTSIRTPTTRSAATPSSTAPRCSGCGRRTSASSGTTAASRRRGRSRTTSWSPTTPRPSTCTRCTASAAWIRPSRRASAPYRLPAP